MRIHQHCSFPALRGTAIIALLLAPALAVLLGGGSARAQSIQTTAGMTCGSNANTVIPCSTTASGITQQSIAAQLQAPSSLQFPQTINGTVSGTITFERTLLPNQGYAPFGVGFVAGVVIPPSYSPISAATGATSVVPNNQRVVVARFAGAAVDDGTFSTTIRSPDITGNLDLGSNSTTPAASTCGPNTTCVPATPSSRRAVDCGSAIDFSRAERPPVA